MTNLYHFTRGALIAALIAMPCYAGRPFGRVVRSSYVQSYAPSYYVPKQVVQKIVYPQTIINNYKQFYAPAYPNVYAANAGQPQPGLEAFIQGEIERYTARLSQSMASQFAAQQAYGQLATGQGAVFQLSNEQLAGIIAAYCAQLGIANPNAQPQPNEPPVFTQRQSIIEQKCAKCHSPPKGGASLDLSNPSALSDEDYQSVIQRISANDDSVRMPKNEPALSIAEAMGVLAEMEPPQAPEQQPPPEPQNNAARWEQPLPENPNQ